MKKFAFSSTMFVEAENEDEATGIFKERIYEFARDAEIEEVT